MAAATTSFGVADALAIFADRHVIIEKSRVVWIGTSTELEDGPGVKDRFLQV